MIYVVVYAKKYKSSKIREVRRKVLYYLCVSYHIYITLL